MTFGKRPKLALSSSHRRLATGGGLRLGVSHHGAPSDWVAPVKATEAQAKAKGKRRK